MLVEATLIVFIVLISLANGLLTCEGVEFSNSGQIIAFPTNVCYGQYINNAYTNTKYECKDRQVYWNLYTTSNCEGEPSSFRLFSSLYPNADYVTEYCLLSDCEFVKLRTYSHEFMDQTECNSFDLTNDDYSESIHVKNYCSQISSTQSSIYSCDDITCKHIVYASLDCTGTMLTETIYANRNDTDCNSGSTAYQIYVNAPIVPNLPCNGFEYTTFGITTALPADVCYEIKSMNNNALNIKSYEYVCINDEIYKFSYGFENCEGIIIANNKASVLYKDLNYIEYCNLGQCEYSKLRSYDNIFSNNTQCNMFKTNGLHTYVETLYISSYCNKVIGNSYVFVCDDLNIKKQFYANENCDGSPYHIEIYSYDINCIASDAFTINAMEAMCGIALSKHNINMEPTQSIEITTTYTLLNYESEYNSPTALPTPTNQYVSVNCHTYRVFISFALLFFMA